MRVSEYEVISIAREQLEEAVYEYDDVDDLYNEYDDEYEYEEEDYL